MKTILLAIGSTALVSLLLALFLLSSPEEKTENGLIASESIDESVVFSNSNQEVAVLSLSSQEKSQNIARQKSPVPSAKTPEKPPRQTGIRALSNQEHEALIQDEAELVQEEEQLIAQIAEQSLSAEEGKEATRLWREETRLRRRSIARQNRVLFLEQNFPERVSR